MIVNYKQEGWEIITQRTHGLLAAQLGMFWKFKDVPRRWFETLVAIAEHDDAEIELDGENLLTEQGGPLNFSMKKFELEHCEKLSMFCITKSRYIALLASIHMEFLHKREAETNEQAKKFLEGQRVLQEKWLNDLGLNREEVYKTYSFLEWCDAFSLLLCQQQIQPEQRSIEISEGPDEQVYELYQVEPGKLTLTPWPYERSSFKVYYESRLIRQLQFQSSAEFREAFYKAEVTETVWEIAEGTKPSKKRKV